MVNLSTLSDNAFIAVCSSAMCRSIVFGASDLSSAMGLSLTWRRVTRQNQLYGKSKLPSTKIARSRTVFRVADIEGSVRRYSRCLIYRARRQQQGHCVLRDSQLLVETSLRWRFRCPCWCSVISQVPQAAHEVLPPCRSFQQLRKHSSSGRRTV